MARRYTFVGNSRTCYRRDRRTITSMAKSDLDVVATLFTARYRNQIEYTRKRIHATLKPLYGNEIPFATRILSQVVSKIHYIMDETGEDIKTVAKELKTYLGFDTKFFRKQGLREIPCESERIIAAYKAMKHNEPKERVRSILFN